MRTVKIFGAISLTFVVVTSPAQLRVEYLYQDFVDRVTAVQDRVEVDDDGIVPATFDLEEYLAVFDKLTMHAPGMRPVCAYHRTSPNWGFPIIIPLADSISLDSFNASWEKNEDEWSSYIASNQLHHKFKAEPSPEGYFQLIAWLIIGRAFAMEKGDNFRSTAVVCSREALDAKFREFEKERDWFWRPIMVEDREIVRHINPAPVIRMEQDRCIVRITTITSLGGIYAETFSILCSFPHIIEKTERECLLNYDGGGHIDFF